ncbi:MAG: SH3 domain-containing protein [Prevotella sp.]|nr:SH3 domain-containing protein [Prevotella sp.]
MMERQHKFYRIFLYLTTAIVAIACIYVAWLYISSNRDWGFDVEWKFWNSTILWPALSVIGFFLQFIDWQHTSFTEGWVIKDSWGRERFVENNDIISWMFGNCLFPLIAHLFLIPCLYGAILYYIVMLPFALVNSLIPYLAAAVCIGIAVMFYKLSVNFEWKPFPFVWLGGAIVVSGLLLWLLSLATTLSFNNHKEGTTISSTETHKTIGIITVKTQKANLRIGPGANYSVYTQSDGTKMQASKGEQFEVLSIDGKWYKVLLPNGDGAFIKKSLCTKMKAYTITMENDSTSEITNKGEIPKSLNRVGTN